MSYFISKVSPLRDWLHKLINGQTKTGYRNNVNSFYLVGGISRVLSGHHTMPFLTVSTSWICF